VASTRSPTLGRVGCCSRSGEGWGGLGGNIIDEA